MKKLIRTVARRLGVNASEWRYLRAQMHSFLPSAKRRDVDVCYVTTYSSEPSWILNTFCEELVRYEDRSFRYVNVDCEELPKADVYFHAHFFIYRNLLFSNPEISKARNVVLFTHPQEDRISARELRILLNSSEAVASMCSQFRDFLVGQGVDQSRVAVVLAGADPQKFQAHTRSAQPIGLCSGYRERKNPELLAKVVEASPHREFCLIGRHWREWSGFGALEKLPNFSYREEVPYDEMPQFYDSIDVLLSPSSLEGGPMPVLEAMMCNVVPVATSIGFCPDLIEHGSNGFLFELTDSVDYVVELIEAAYCLKSDVRGTVEHLTWQHYHESVSSLYAA